MSETKPLMDPEEALNEIALYFNIMGITEKEWGHKFYSQYMLVFQGIRNIVKATGRLKPHPTSVSSRELVIPK